MCLYRFYRGWSGRKLKWMEKVQQGKVVGKVGKVGKVGRYCDDDGRF